MKIFYDLDGTFSLRKAGTALIFILYAYCVGGFCITHCFNEIPLSYQGIILMVFTFYFLKDRKLRNPLSKLKNAGVQPDPNNPRPR